MLRPVSTLEFPVATRSKLQEFGFLYCEDLWQNKSCNNEANLLLKQWDQSLLSNWDLQTSSSFSTQSALDVFREECDDLKIVTFSNDVDNVLDGGISLKTITEFCGAPGAGKTQMCLQLCIDVQIPEAFGGLGKEALLIDTDSGLRVHRVEEMAQACVSHCQLITFSKGDEEMKQQLANFSSVSILQGLHHISVHNVVQLVAALQLLPDFLQQNSQIKLLVVDSLAFPFLHSVDNTLARTRLLCTVVRRLQMLATKFNMGVVITNQLTTRLEANGESYLVPALGNHFGHCVNRRVLLASLGGKQFAAALIKSVTQPATSVKFKITSSGVRDCASLM